MQQWDHGGSTMRADMKHTRAAQLPYQFRALFNCERISKHDGASAGSRVNNSRYTMWQSSAALSCVQLMKENLQHLFLHRPNK